MTEVLLIDLSSLAHPIWHMSGAQPDVDYVSNAIVARVEALAASHPLTAICCDSGRTFRHEIDPRYKATRPEREETLHHQIRVAVDRLTRDGFPVWSARGFEADDVIATATAATLGLDDHEVLIASADKDLLQLVGPRVRVKSLTTGDVLDAGGVVVKLGVEPDQVVDYLTLIGDTADNVKGAPGIGVKRAQELLNAYGTLDEVYRQLDLRTIVLPSIVRGLDDLRPRLEIVRTLIKLRTDVPIPYAELFTPRVSEAAAAFMEETPAMDDVIDAEVPDDYDPIGGVPEPARPQPEPPAAVAPAPQVLAAAPGAVAQLALAPKEWALQLDPRTMEQAKALATMMFDSRMFSSYGTPQAVLSTIMVGRELGLPAMASLRLIHNIEGKHALSAQLMVALILRSGQAEYFRPIEISETAAVFETLRKGCGQKPLTLAHTIEMARTAGLVKDKSGWVKNPTDMLVSRASSRLARLVYPDVVGGLYSPEELAEMREERIHG